MRHPHALDGAFRQGVWPGWEGHDESDLFSETSKKETQKKESEKSEKNKQKMELGLCMMDVSNELYQLYNLPNFFYVTYNRKCVIKKRKSEYRKIDCSSLYKL